MLYATVVTVYSGIRYFSKNLDIIKLEFDSRVK
jgi:hypothetical protein